MKDNILLAAIVLAVAFIFCVFVYCESNKYTVVLNDAGGAYMLNKKSGDVWVLRGNTRYEQKNVSVEEAELLK